jgi:hypothetical protein
LLGRTTSRCSEKSSILCRKHISIEHNMPRNINTMRGGIRTPIAFLIGTEALKNTLLATKLKLVTIVRAKKRIAGTPKNS